jgi:predicted Fe-Mo cluster-binding NifX family protein
MKVCFPIEKDLGLASIVFGHFGSAPFFLLVDTDTSQTTTISNSDQHHSHGACNPLQALTGQQVDGIVVNGIGGGALNHLQQSGLRVFKAQGTTVQESIDMIKQNSLPEFTPRDTCQGHGHGNGCNH